MWVFTNRSFISLVRHKELPGKLLVRARLAGHIEAAFPKAEVGETPEEEYPFRAVVSKAEAAEWLLDQAEHITYPNFENSIEKLEYHDACMGVWCVLHKAGQNALFGGEWQPVVENPVNT